MSLQVWRTFLSILTDFNSAVVWMVLNVPLISNLSNISYRMFFKDSYDISVCLLFRFLSFSVIERNGNLMFSIIYVDFMVVHSKNSRS